jgi:hypothetical protein
LSCSFSTPLAFGNCLGCFFFSTRGMEDRPEVMSAVFD